MDLNLNVYGIFYSFRKKATLVCQILHVPPPQVQLPLGEDGGIQVVIVHCLWKMFLFWYVVTSNVPIPCLHACLLIASGTSSLYLHFEPFKQGSAVFVSLYPAVWRVLKQLFRSRHLTLTSPLAARRVGGHRDGIHHCSLQVSLLPIDPS